MKTWMIVTASLLCLFGVLGYGLKVWFDLGEVAISWQGWLAIGLGASVTLALGGGLMALVFYSSRHGHDDAHHDQSAFRTPPPGDWDA